MTDEQNKGQEDPKDPTGNPQQTPPTPDEGGKSTQTQDDLPERFKGKSPADIAKSYLELEKKLGEHSEEVGKTREQLERWEILGKVIQSNPELRKQLEAEITKQAGGDPEPLQNKNGKVEKDDTRIAVENEIIGRFEGKYGIDSLESDKKKELHTKIGLELSDMLDPGGNKTYREILDGISLEKLPKYLDKAYRLATLDDEAEQARSKALLDTRRNIEASFSSMPSRSVRGNEGLSEAERQAAKKLGVSEEEYIKQKKIIAEEE